MTLYRHHFENDFDFIKHLSDLNAGCDADFDIVQDELEREFAELRMTFETAY